MIVVDASIVAPVVLLDEAPLPPALTTAFALARLTAPAHWPLEIGNLLLVARRRGRLKAMAADAYDRLAAFRVEVAAAPDMPTCQAIVTLAEQQQLTVYDAAYLHLALIRSATLATLDGPLVRAANRRGIEVLTF